MSRPFGSGDANESATVYNASEDTFPLPLNIKHPYGPFGFPTRCQAHRPYKSLNFVMGLDGRASFTESKGRAGGKRCSDFVGHCGTGMRSQII